MPHNEISDTIGRMKEVLLERGRTTYTLEDETGAVCLLGAACVAQGITTQDNLNTYNALRKTDTLQYLAHRLGPDLEDPDPNTVIWHYNDLVAQSDQEVFDFLDEAQIAAKDL